ncbi:VOC family protein [Mycobacterium sp. 94-17]|uniref:VOC family protein n=1 Tax=Mycobacterium sp. 94-17 TaxID=2986147 RepID=UPI002D1EB4D2|nr:VOC family protein [Mycobacterium sp. 94-17]MEB4211097.1 VOC family protein [Mycobacterium sp. 94-17]
MLVAKQYNQIAWVVDDLDAAVQYWLQTARIGPFFVGAHVGGIFTEASHRGSPAELDISCAIAQAGPVQIELIKQHDSAPSPYRDVFAEGEGGLHHICSFVDDIDAECRNYQEHGFEVVMRGVVAGQTPVAYVDTRPMIGCMSELMERRGLAVEMFAASAAAAADWDGTDPIRDLATLMS